MPRSIFCRLFSNFSHNPLRLISLRAVHIALAFGVQCSMATATDRDGAPLATNPNSHDIKALYGPDDRLQSNDTRLTASERKAAHSVGILVSNRWISRDWTTGYLKVDGESLSKKQNLCPNSQFENEISIGYCSGFLASPDLFVTAGHCLKSSIDCANTSVIFDYDLQTPATDNQVVTPARLVFGCKNIHATKIDRSRGIDFTIFRLDRPAADRESLQINRDSQLTRREPLSIISHPDGLPLKVSRGAVTDWQRQKSYFSTNLASFIGSSGAPVFHKDAASVEGILVRGDRDYIPSGSCFVVNRCDTFAGCRGSEVLSSANFSKLIPPKGPAFVIKEIGVSEVGTTVEGTPDPGETLDLRLIVRSIGTSAVNSGAIEIFSRTESAVVIKKTAKFEGVPRDGVLEVGEFRIRILPGTRCSEIVEFDVVVTSSDGTQTSSVARLPLGRDEYDLFPIVDKSVPIPDNLNTGLQFKKFVDRAPEGRPVQVIIYANHPDPSQLSISAKSPSGFRAELFSHGISPDGLVSTSNPPRLSGIYGRDLVPYDSLSEFSKAGTGDWVISIVDNIPGAKGELNYAALAFANRVCK